MPTCSSAFLRRAAAQIERTGSKNMMRLVVMSLLLLSPLLALGEASATSVPVRDQSLLLALDLKDILPRRRVRPPRVPRTPVPRPTPPAQTPTQAPANVSPENLQPRPARSPAPISPQEQAYLDSLTPEARQLYEIIQRAKRGLQHQGIANVLGMGFGFTPRGTHQTAQDLDREFQNAIRSVENGSAAAESKPGNQLLQQILNKRSNETPEQWYARTNFLLFYTSGEEYRLWKATLSQAQAQAYDALAQKHKTEVKQEVGEAVKDAVRRDLSCRYVRDSNGESVRVCDD